jgi:outer membrane protein assembly factor BamA
MKKLFFIAALLIINFAANAQVSGSLNFGVFKPTYEGSESQIGFNVSAKYKINPKISVGANIGYFSKNDKDLEFKSSTMPIVGLVEYHITDKKVSPYLGLDFGMYNFGTSFLGIKSNESNLGLAPTFGINFAFSEKIGFNTNIKYHNIFTPEVSTKAIGLNAGLSIMF